MLTVLPTLPGYASPRRFNEVSKLCSILLSSANQEFVNYAGEIKTRYCATSVRRACPVHFAVRFLFPGVRMIEAGASVLKVTSDALASASNVSGNGGFHLAPVTQTGDIRHTGVSNRCELAFLRTTQELIMNDRAPREIGRPRRVALEKVLCGLPISAVQNVHSALKTPAVASRLRT